MMLLPPSTTHWFTIRQSRWGWVRLICSQNGLTSVSFADQESDLCDAPLPVVERLIETQTWSDAPSHLEFGYSEIEYPTRSSHVAIDIGGSPFQQSVWAALRRVPWGKTCSYAELAASLGHPRAVRAVGTACGANPLAVVIPCHRVLRSDGGIGGYRWGIARKQALLEYENKHIPLR